MPKFDTLRWRLSQRGENVTVAQLELAERLNPELFGYFTQMISQMYAVKNTATDVYTMRGMSEHDFREVEQLELKLLDHLIKWLRKQLI